MGPIDHGFVHSIYTEDPNGIQVEVTTKVPKYDEIMAHERSLVEKAMADWEVETRARKDAFRAAAVEARSKTALG